MKVLETHLTIPIPTSAVLTANHVITIRIKWYFLLVRSNTLLFLHNSLKVAFCVLGFLPHIILTHSLPILYFLLLTLSESVRESTAPRTCWQPMRSKARHHCARTAYITNTSNKSIIRKKGESSMACP